MGLFRFLKGEAIKSAKKGFIQTVVSGLERLTEDTVKITFGTDKRPLFKFEPGQYVNVSTEINGNEEIRSYSICSGPEEPISIAVKAVKNGYVSQWLNTQISIGETMLISLPQGNFKLKETQQHVVCLAAGSGITPIIAMAKAMKSNEGSMHLFYGSKNYASIIFRDELNLLDHVKVKHFLSNEEHIDCQKGRLTKEVFIKELKANLSLLKADAFFICGPEAMIIDMVDVLNFFGVADSKIHYELFTTPVLMKSKSDSVESDFKGNSHVKAILDGEAVEFNLESSGKSLLEAVLDAGLDAPYSCKGGVCCSCKAKILNGSAGMTMNFSLTDEEIKEGYILTCQAHPGSEELTISYDA